jgi:heptosyltransferase III
MLRMLDRRLGPLIVAAGGLRAKRPPPTDPRKIGLLDGTAIGDTVMMSAVARDVAATHRDAEIIFFASAPTLSVARRIDGVHAVPIELTKPRAAVTTIRKQQLDVLLDFGPWPRVEAVYSLLSGSRFTAGFRAEGQRRHFGYDRWVDYSSRVHALQNFRELAKVIGVDSRSPPRLEPPGRVSGARLPPQPYAVFHLWAAGVKRTLKEWPAERWRALAAALVARGFTIALTGAKADEARTRAFVAGSSQPLRRRLLDLTGKHDLDELLDVLADSRCVVSVNTGVMHLAAAVGAATVALNGPTAEHRWGPIGNRATSVNSDFPDCGYLHLGWEYDGHRTDCMEGISVERVLDAVGEVTRDP